MLATYLPLLWRRGSLGQAERPEPSRDGHRLIQNLFTGPLLSVVVHLNQTLVTAPRASISKASLLSARPLRRPCSWAGRLGLGVDGCGLGLLRVRRNNLPVLVYKGLVGILMEDVVEDDLAVLLNLLVGRPLGIIGAQVGGLGVHLHLFAGGATVDLGVDKTVVRDPLPEEQVAIRVVLELHIQSFALRVPEPDGSVQAGPDVGKLCSMRMTLHHLQARVVGRHVECRSDLAEPPAVSFVLLTLDYDARPVVV